MARIEKVSLLDDIDGSEAAETVEYSLDGKAYEIDLNGENAKELREALAGFIESSRPRGKVMLGRFTQVKPSRSRTDTQAIREWARGNGFPDLKERGRVPAVAVEAYEQRAQ